VILRWFWAHWALWAIVSVTLMTPVTPSPRVGIRGGIGGGIGGGGDYASAEKHGETDKRELHGWMTTEVIMLFDEGCAVMIEGSWLFEC